MAEPAKKAEKKKQPTIKKNTQSKTSKTKKKTTNKAVEKQNPQNKAATSLKEEKVIAQSEKSILPTQTMVWQNFLGCFKKYFMFNGRASRYEYFSFMIGMMATGFVLGFLSAFIDFFGWLANVYILLVIIPSLTVLSRRLHDIGRNLWNGLFNWLLYGVIVSLVLLCVKMYLDDTATENGMLNLLLLLGIYYIPLITLLIVVTRKFIFICRAGEDKENKYGLKPALNAPEYHKTTIQLIITYFAMLLAIFVINTTAHMRMQQAYQHEILMQLKNDMSLLERIIHKEQEKYVTYSWLDNDYLLEHNLVPDRMVSGNKTIVTPYQAPIGILGLEDSFVLSLDYLSAEDCRLIARQQWPFFGLQMTVFHNLTSSDGPQPLTSETQCDGCKNNLCQIYWVIR